MNSIEKLKVLTGESDGTLLQTLLEDAEEFVLAYTNRTTLPTTLNKTVRDLAVIAYNRIGTEGETSRSESGESYSFDNAPKQIYSILNKNRLARCGGHAYEKVETENADDSE